MCYWIDSQAECTGGDVDWMATAEDGYGQAEGIVCGYQVEDVDGLLSCWSGMDGRMVRREVIWSEVRVQHMSYGTAMYVY
jgi:hypothetical protein